MRQDYWSLGMWGRIPVQMHWTVLLSFAWLYFIFWDLTAMLIGSVALAIVFIAHEFGHVLVLRRRKIAVTGISFFGIHGETSYNEYAAKPGDVVAVAWAGVGAQMLVLVLALAASALIPFHAIALGPAIWGPMFIVFTKFNVFLTIIALLPIGPFDGHDAWRVIRRTRNALRRSRVKRPPPEPERVLSPEEQRALEESSQRTAGELIDRLSRRTDAPTQER